jgi:proline iminopeptidase
MKLFLRACAIFTLLFTLKGAAQWQDGATRAEFECLAMATSSSGVPLPSEPGLSPSFHHVWTPGLSYGYFKSNGLNLLYETEGDAGEVIIVVHGGAGLPHEYFHPMLSNLSHYAKLVYFDRRADMHDARSSEQMATIEEMAEDLDALRVALGLNRVTLLGHSFGATIALNYALRHPDNVKRLILVSAAATLENPAEAEKRIVKMLKPAEMNRYQSNEGGVGAANPCERVRQRYAVLYPHFFHKRVPYEFDRGVYTVYFDSLSKKIALSSQSKGLNVETRLNQIKAPVLVVAGRHNPVTPLDQSTRLAEALPSSKLVVMEHSSHFPFYEENYLFTQWVRQFMATTNDQVDDRKMVAPTQRSTRGSR